MVRLVFNLKNILEALNAAQAGKEPTPAENYAPEQARALCAGALLTLNSSCEPRSLRLGFGAEIVAHTLMSAWEIADADDLRRTIEVLLHEGQHLGMDPAIQAVQAMAKNGAGEIELFHVLVDAFGISDACALYQIEQGFIENLSELNPSWTDMRGIHAQIGSLRAWDLERAAFNARMGFEAGYLDEAQTFAILERCRAVAQATYDSWQSYGVAFVLGRTIGYSYDNDTLVEAINNELGASHSLFNTYPLGA